MIEFRFVTVYGKQVGFLKTTEGSKDYSSDISIDKTFPLPNCHLKTNKQQSFDVITIINENYHISQRAKQTSLSFVLLQSF